MTGYFESDTLKFGSTVLTNTQTTIPHENLFLAKYSSTGNVTWAKSKGRTKVLSIGIDNLDNTYLLGIIVILLNSGIIN
ncbi:MAG: hypothetical protein IPG08_17835 [Sphingobacteriaceae bacterium]|nr:hypothetical protein [Sphingobacteriaceae bacterium]